VTAQEVRSIIEQSSDRIGDWMQFGRINVARGLEAIVPAVQVDFTPEDITLFTGSASIGDVMDVQKSDALRYALVSRASPIGPVAGAQARLVITAPLSQLSKITVELVASGPSPATGMVWLYNWRTRSYDFAKAFPLRPSDQLVTVQLESPDAYVSPVGDVYIVSRAHIARRFPTLSSFTYKLNQIRVVATVRRE
jgi:hypothetical protein